MRCRLLCAVLLAVVGTCALAMLAVPAEAPAGERGKAVRPEDGALLARIDRHRQETWRWQRLMRRPLTPASRSLTSLTDTEYQRWVLALWTRRVRTARRQAANPPHKRAWSCIQRHEGPWHDPHAPYFGGLQMDLTFQRLYGRDLLRRKGTADRWTPVEQMWVAERAHRSGRGFYPWPNTARYCGLI